MAGSKRPDRTQRRDRLNTTGIRYRLAALFCCAHLFFCAALIRARAAALRVRLPPRRLAPLTSLRVSVPASKLRTCFSRAISLSIAATRSDDCIGSLVYNSYTRWSKHLIADSGVVLDAEQEKDDAEQEKDTNTYISALMVSGTAEPDCLLGASW